jgi:hypothetical protein
MTNSRFLFVALCTLILISSFVVNIYANNKATASVSVDVVSRYIWRGIMINEAPNIQSSFNLSCGGARLGLWGSTTLSKENTSDDNYALSQEIDLIASYSHQIFNQLAATISATDYYYPNAGISIGNFNDYDNPDGPGAHTIEAGLSLSSSGSIPISISGYVNVYNEEGNNTYFQVDYPVDLASIDINLFLGTAGGSEKNPDYYGTDHFNVINLGFTAKKSVIITDKFTLPIFVTFIINPRAEVSYLVAGFSL